MKIIVPCDVCIKRYYRAYAEVDENATNDEIQKAIVEAILENQDRVLTEDPYIEIEEDDISVVYIDHDGAWTEEEDEEIGQILSEVRK